MFIGKYINHLIVSLLLAVLLLMSFISPGPIVKATSSEIGIAIEPQETTTATGETFSVDIQITAGEYQVDGVQAFLDFDTAYLEVSSFTPGTALSVSMLAPPYFDNTSGEIWYAAGAFSGFPTGTFTLATIEFTVTDQIPAGGTDISFAFDSEAGRMTKITRAGENYVIEPVVDGVVLCNNPPDQPSNISPADGAAAVGLTPTLQSSAFSDPDDDTHAASQWQISAMNGDYSTPVSAFDSGEDTLNLTSITLIPGILGYDTNYYWRVQYKDSQGIWSEWSEETVFTTESQVPNIGPDAQFSAEPLRGDAPLNVIFTDLSVLEDGIVSWLWEFGDGQTSTEQNPAHEYTQVGTYTVSLTVTEADEDNDIESKNDYISVSKVLAQQTISSTSQATVQAENKQITIEFTEGSVAADTIVTIREEPQNNSPACPSGFKAGATCFSVDLTADLVPGTMVTITIKYSDADLEACGGDPNQLTLSRYDENVGEWVVLPTTVDTEAMTLTASTDQLSQWMVMAKEPHAEPTKRTSLWIWLATVVGGLLVLIAVSSVFIQARRRLANR